MQRVLERRTKWSDIFMCLTLDQNICQKSLFYSTPTNKKLENALDFLQPQTNSTNVETDISLDDLETFMPKKTFNESNDIELFLNIGVQTEKIKNAVLMLSSVPVTSIDSERCFSVCGRVLTPLRTNLNDDKF